MKTIYLTVKFQYGNAVYYPKCPISNIFADIAGTKTLTADVIKKIKAIGFDIKADVDVNNIRSTFEIV